MSGLSTIRSNRHAFATALLGVIVWLSVATSARAQANPIKIGFSMSLTGAVAPNGKQLLAALEIWRDDVNAKGGLLGRPVELVQRRPEQSVERAQHLHEAHQRR
jgi:ABC-type branched-subunit amino acid transport system substrate-binding protein